MLDLMPAPRLIFNEWDKHGTCSGLSPNAYFETVRKARAVVKIPDAYIEPGETLMVTPDEVEEAFVKANPGLSRDAIAVTCDSRRLGEVRICIGKDLRFRACPEIDVRACRREQRGHAAGARWQRGADALAASEKRLSRLPVSRETCARMRAGRLPARRIRLCAARCCAP